MVNRIVEKKIRDFVEKLCDDGAIDPEKDGEDVLALVKASIDSFKEKKDDVDKKGDDDKKSKKKGDGLNIFGDGGFGGVGNQNVGGFGDILGLGSKKK